MARPAFVQEALRDLGGTRRSTKGHLGVERRGMTPDEWNRFKKILGTSGADRDCMRQRGRMLQTR